jgi:SAM-dependent methyltransferase
VGCSVDLVDSDLWEMAASWWQSNFTEGADPEYEEQILPLVERYARGAKRALDIGCGEGQMSRRLERNGTKVVGLDLAASQVRVARERGGSSCYLQAGAQHLPLCTASFDTVVLCLAIEHVEPFEAVFREVARVLMPGGRFVLLLVHPLLQAPGSGWVEVVDSDERFWRVGSYLEEDITTEEVGPGVPLSFVHRPISRYVHEMGKCGLLIDDMVEPPPPLATIEETGGYPNGATIPRLLLLCARRSA